MIFVGIDPGKKGAIAWQNINLRFGPSSPGIDCGEDFIGVCLDWLMTFRNDPDKVFAVIEEPPCQPKFGARTNRYLGESFGQIVGACKVLRIPHETVHPRVWQKFIFAGKRRVGTDTKKMAVETARALFPGVSLKRTERSIIDDHNIADAILLSEYGRRIRWFYPTVMEA